MPLTATHLVDEGVYIVDRSWGHQYEVDGMPMPNNQFVVKSLDSIVQVDTQQGELLNYRDAEGNTLSAADYAAQLAALREGSHFEQDDDGGERVFPNLDAEFAYRKFVARWTAGERAPTVVTRTPVEVTISEVRVNSGDPDIVSLWNSPTIKADQRHYTMSRDAVMSQAAREQCAAAGLKFENEGRAYLRFAKIEGEYAFNDSFDESKRLFIGTLEQCKAEKAMCIQRVTEVVRVRAAKKSGLALKNAATVLIELRAVQAELRGVRPSQGSTNYLSRANHKLAALIAEVERELPPSRPVAA
jgi:hypothetical protein